MELRDFGKTGLRVSVLGFGGAEIGYQNVDPTTATQLLNEALDAGLNVIDTAECYKNSEELIGDAVSHRRDDFLLFTKTGHANGYDKPDWSRSGTLASIERSLKRLKTDHVDLVLLHSCSEEELRSGEAIRGLEDARQKGHTRLIGYSGDHAAARYAVECGLFDALEISVNVADQEAIEDVLPEAKRRGLGVIAKRPVANVAWRSGENPPADSYHEEYWRRLRELRYDWTDATLDESVTTALRFTLTIPGVSTMIVGTTKPGRYRQNAETVAAGELPADRFTAIRERWRAVAPVEWTGQT
ncbi:MAG: aldo/keto reductase [Planctomycetaceae bacterium]